MSEEFFIQGNEACAKGALKAGCRFFAGYPITPSTEVAETLARELPKVGGAFVQMEDEIASAGAIIGGSWGGSKSMTATSGPGISLMQENIRLDSGYEHFNMNDCYYGLTCIAAFSCHGFLGHFEHQTQWSECY